MFAQLPYTLQEASFGFAPDQLDLAHLDQTDTASHAPAHPKKQAGLHPDASPYEAVLNVAAAQNSAPHQLTHLDSRGRAQMVDVGQVWMHETVLCL